MLVRLLAVPLSLAVLLAAAPAVRMPPRAGSAGVTLALPAGWHTIAGVDGPVTDPVTRVVVASAPLHYHHSQCQVVQYAFAPGAVALVVLEWRSQFALAERWPARPRRFTARNLPAGRSRLECFERGRAGVVQFRDHRRLLGAYLVAGPGASPALVARARAVLDTLRVAG